MSVYISGVEMPKEHPLYITLRPDGSVHVWDSYGGECYGTRAIPVPPHGRLIDADALGIRDAEKRAYEAYQMEKREFFIEEPLLEYKRGLSEGLIRASGIVRFAPTIIQASKEGEG